MRIFSFLCRYNVVFMFLTYFLPIGSMTFTYARVGLELWGSQSIGECTQRQLDNIKSKRKVSKRREKAGR
jgi:tachykinin receptor 3